MAIDLTKYQMTVLNAAAQDLGRARWISGRRLRTSLPRSNSLAKNAAIIESLTPIYLTRQGTEPEDQYSLTLEGLLASESSRKGALVIEAVLRCMRELFARDPDFRFYTWQDLTPHFAHPVEFEFVDSIIQIAALVNGGGGSPGKPDYRWGTPLEIEALSRLERIQDFTDYRRAPKPSKTLGTTAAHLLSTLHERRKKVFSIRDVASITRLQPDSARSFMTQLVQRGITSRLKPGLFVIVPQELADGSEFLGNPYVVGRELAEARDYFISHASAMDLHRMLTQPPLVVYVTTTRSIRRRTIVGTEYRFPRIKSEHLFGITDVWVDKTEQVRVSDLERTIIDGLRQPEYCGGISEVAKGFWMRRRDVQPQKLIDYALRLDIGAVIRRLGFLLEVLQVRVGDDIERLRKRLTATYDLFDPTLPPEGRHLSRWKLRLNVSPEEIETVRST